MRKPRSRLDLSPQPLSIGWQGGPYAGKVTARPLPQPLSIEWRGWPQAGRGPTGWGGSDYATLDLLFACFVANLTTQHIQPQLITSIQFKFLTVRNLKKGKTLCHIKEKSRGCLWLSASNSTAVSRMAKLAGTWSFGSIRRRRSKPC